MSRYHASKSLSSGPPEFWGTRYEYGTNGWQAWPSKGVAWIVAVVMVVPAWVLAGMMAQGIGGLLVAGAYFAGCYAIISDDPWKS